MMKSCGQAGVSLLAWLYCNCMLTLQTLEGLPIPQVYNRRHDRQSECTSYGLLFQVSIGVAFVETVECLPSRHRS